MKQKILSRAVSAALAVSMISAAGLPAFASGNVQYMAEDETTHTIRWAEGIAEPQMPSEEEEGSFTERQVTIGDTAWDVLEVPYKGAQGWYDLTQEKKPEKKEESENPEEGTKEEAKETEPLKLVYDSGYAASAANLTYWWLQQNQENLSLYLQPKPIQEEGLADPHDLYDMLTAPASQKADDDRIFSLYMKAFPEEAEPDQLLDFFMSGYTGSKEEENAPSNYEPNALGGFFYPVFGKERLTRRESVSIQTLRDAIAKNDGAILRLQKDEALRYVNLWGMETDDGGNLCALFVTDSQDDLGLIRFEVSEKEPLMLAGMEITGLYVLSLGEELWAEYEPPKEEKDPPKEETPKAEVPEKAPQIQWEQTVYEWSEDFKTCTATRIAADDSKKTETEKAESVSVETAKPSHQEPGTMTYTADFQADWAETQVKTREIPRLEVSWNAPVYEWDESMRLCTATRTAREDESIREVAETGVQAKETREPTCTQKGQTTFTADFEEDWAETQVKTLENIDKLTPNWDVTKYQWSPDHKECWAVRVCKNETDGSHQEKVPGKVSFEQTRKPTGARKGETTYTAEFNVDWAENQETTAEDIPVLAAKWSAPVYTWTDDQKTCIAIRTDENDPGRKETAEAEVTSSVTRQATCTLEGQTTYRAEFQEDWAETQEKTVSDIEKLTPDWSDTEYRWSEDHRSCWAVRVCKNESDGSHVDKIQGRVTYEQTKKPTGSKKGETTYTAQFDVKWAQTQTETVEDVPVLDPVWSAPQYTWSEDLKTCTAVRTDQNDPDRKQTAEAEVTEKVTKKATCKAKGETTYTAVFGEDWAVTQEKVLENLPVLEPDWGKTTYEWSEDHRTCTAVRVCRNEEDHIETASADISVKETKAPTLTEEGEATFTAKFHVDWAETQTASVNNIPKVQDLWYPPRYQWTEDYSKCIATRVNQNDKDLTQTAYGVVSSKKTKAPTNNMKGETTYTATFKEDWANTQKKVVANIPAVPGNPNSKPQNTEPAGWNAPTYEWSKDFSRCTARRTRKGDESNVDLTWAEVTKKETRPASCDRPGEAVYTAKFSEKWAKDQKIKGEIQPLPHKLQKVEEVAATAGKDGIQAHYACTQCHKLFLDPKGTQEVTRDQLRLGKPSVSEGYAILNGVPEKDHQIAISADKFTQALKDNPGSVGVSISVGSATVTYDKKDVETIVNAAGDNKKIQLEIYKTDSTDSGLTLDQIQTADRNPEGLLYMVDLSYVQNGKNVPIADLSGSNVTVPYTGTDAVRIYQVAEDGTFRETTGTYQDTFVTFHGGSGLYLLTESRPSAETPQKSGSRIGVIIWSAVLVVSGLLGIGLIGFYLYQKKLDREEELAPHKFSHPGRTDFEETEEAVPEENDDPDFTEEMDLQNDFTEPALSQEPLQTDWNSEEPAPVKVNKTAEIPAAPKTSEKKSASGEGKASVSPLAPKAPMQPSIAEKTAEAENHKHTKA